MATTELLRVTNIRVEKLFGRYDHEIPLHTEERVTIIHGPNGVGKTVLLRLVAAALSGNIFELMKAPFRVFEVTLSDGAILGFNRESSTMDLGDSGNSKGTCYLKRKGNIQDELRFDVNQMDLKGLASQINRDVPWLTRIGEERFVDLRSDEIIHLAELISRFPEIIPEKAKNDFFSVPEWMLDIKNKVHVHFIEAQRLLRLDQRSSGWDRHNRLAPQYVATVKSHARDLQARISVTMEVYAKQSQSLDQTFPQRLLGRGVGTLSVDELKERMRTLETKRQKLKQIGLVGEDSSSQIDVSALEKLYETNKNVMTLYVEDTEKKLGALDDIAQRVEILLGNINKKLAHKSIVIDRENGLTVMTDDEQIVALDDLSSGEQHELVLLYDLLFRVRPNTLVLIDEPELSLHLTWQKDFLPDLLQIVETTEFDVLLATHSPFIIGERNDLMVPMSTNGDNLEVGKAS